jgi:alkaline phosphatase
MPPGRLPEEHASGRRAFLARGALVLAGLATARWPANGGLAADMLQGRSSARPVVRFGLLTDVHYADKATAGTRVYRDSLAKMQVAVRAFNETAGQDAAGLAFAATLGDMVDSPGPAVTDETVATELGYLKTIEAEWAKARTERHYVLGNHCVDTLTKAEFFANTAARPAPYSFDVPFRGVAGALHVIVLDACFTAEGAPYGRKNFDWRDTNIPESQIEWLAGDLAATPNPVVLLTHQRLDGSGDLHVKNAARVRAVIERSADRVVTVFQGHSHENFLGTVNGVSYTVLRAMVEQPGAANNAFALVELFADASAVIRGHFRQAAYDSLHAPGARR